MSKEKILIVVALESELSDLLMPPGVEVIHTGIGKINAAVATTASIIRSRPALVVNFGTAGKINRAVHGLVEIAQVVQRDMMAMPLAPRGVTPFSEEPAALFSGYGGICCGTGDSFVTASDAWLEQEEIDIVDMELFAIAHTCNRHGVPWRAFKFITDDANTSAAEDWSGNLHKGEELFRRRLEEIRESTLNR